MRLPIGLVIGLCRYSEIAAQDFSSSELSSVFCFTAAILRLKSASLCPFALVDLKAILFRCAASDHFRRYLNRPGPARTANTFIELMSCCGPMANTSAASTAKH
jgi:hypothetical protein